MKKLFFALLAMCTLITAYSQSDNNLQTRKVSGFHGVEVSGGIDLFLKSGPESVSVTASSTSARDHIVTEVVDGILRIHMEDNWHGSLGQSRKAYVSISKLEKLGASGGSDVDFQNEITTDRVGIDLSGGSDLAGKLNAKELVINQSGGSDVKLSGNVENLKVDASGGSDFEGYGLITDFASLNASGGSDSELTVNKELRISASGASDVSYKGKASVKEIKTSGSSSVTHKD